MRTRRLALATVMIAVLATSLIVVPTTSVSAAPLTTQTFQTPSGNIGCAIYGRYLRCDILSGLNPEPNGQCEGDWTGLSVKAGGKAGAVCAGDTVYDPNAPVLDYGRRWKRRGIVCISRETGLRCRNDVDHGFLLSRDKWRVF